jgi:hypothetical protein
MASHLGRSHHNDRLDINWLGLYGRLRVLQLVKRAVVAPNASTSGFDIIHWSAL